MPREVYRRVRLALTIVASTLALGALVGSGVASARTLPAQGIFDNCSLDSQLLTCIQRLEVMHRSGLQVVVNPLNGSLTNVAAYAGAARNLGMKVMWSLSNPGWWRNTAVAGYYPAFSAACGCTANAQLLAYTVHWLGQLPGTYGYYAADDSMLSPGDRPGVAGYVAAIKAADPVHTVLISAAQQSQANQYVGIADMVGDEIYPVTTSSLMPVGNHLADWQSVQQSASDEQRAASRAGRPAAFILQAFTFGDNLDDGEAVGVCNPGMTKLGCYDQLRYPSPAAQLQLRNEVLKHADPKLILWWSFQGSYGQAGTDTYSIYPTGATAAVRWAGLSAAIQAPYPGASVKATAATAHTAQVPTQRRKTGAGLRRATHSTSRHHHARRHRAVDRARTRHA